MQMDAYLQKQAPFVEEVLRYLQRQAIPFHTPGHRGGAGLDKIWNDPDLLRMDLTELSGMDWEGSRLAAERMAAEFYHADVSRFLVQGASQGIYAALLGCFNPGDYILVDRNAHVSVFNAIALAGLNPVYIENCQSAEWGLPTGINRAALKAAIKQYPAVKGLIVTNPTYQGIATPLAFYREAIGDRILIVDEAHGGYFEWSGMSGFDAYLEADVWIQGTHKFLGSLTQTAMLHLRLGRINSQKIIRRLEMITTTSPSFLLMASLDMNRAFLENDGRKMFAEKITAVRELKQRLAGFSGITVLDEHSLANPEQIVDPWKLSFSLLGKGFTGFDVDYILREEYSIQSEYADYNQVTFFIPPWQDTKEIIALEQAVIALIKRPGLMPKAPLAYIFPKAQPGVSPREAVFSEVREIVFEKAAGEIAAEVIAPYPPGIPIVVPGERITDSIIEVMRRILTAGGRIRGMNSRKEIYISCVGACR